MAAARDAAVVDGGLVYDAELVERLAALYDFVSAEVVDATNFIAAFERPTAQEQASAATLLASAGAVLAPFDCNPDLRRFEPASLACLLSTPSSVFFSRDLARSRDAAGAVWAGILDDLRGEAPVERSQLCFNLANPLVARIMALESEPARAASIGILYVQALMLGRHAVSDGELRLLDTSLASLLAGALA